MPVEPSEVSKLSMELLAIEENIVKAIRLIAKLQSDLKAARTLIRKMRPLTTDPEILAAIDQELLKE